MTFADGGHLATLTVDGVTLAAMRLVGVPDLGAASVARTETVGLWCEEAAPALVLDSATGVVVDVWALALTSRGSRVPSISYPAVQTLNYPDEDHWTWQRYVARPHPGTAYVRVVPGARATDEDGAAWREALAGRPDLQRRLLDGQPGVIAQGPQVALGYSSDRHLSPTRLLPTSTAPILIGIDGGLTPSATLAQYVGGGAELRVLAALACERGGTRQLCEDFIRPWLAQHASWVLGTPRALVIHIDPSLDVPDQSNLEANPVRVIHSVLGAMPHHGPIDWPSRRDPLLALLAKMNPITGRAALQLDPDHGSGLDRALSGRWHYPLVRGQVLAKRPRRQPGGRYPGVFELMEDERERPETAFSMVHPANVHVATDVVCFRHAADLPSEINAAGGQTNEAGRQVFGRDRKCAEWCEYVPGLEPADHFMELRQQQIEQDRRDFHVKMSQCARRPIVISQIGAS